MTLFDTAKTIRGWIRSCTQSDQLDLCQELVKDYVSDRFEGKIEMIGLAHAVTDLNNEITERRLIIASTDHRHDLPINNDSNDIV